MKKSTSNLLRFPVILIYIIVACSFFITLFEHQTILSKNKAIQQLSISGTVSVDGNPQIDISDEIWHHEINRTVTLIGHFNHNITHGDSLILWPRNLRVKLYVNDTLKLSTGQRESFPNFIQYAGNSYQIFYVGDISTEDIIRIEIQKAYESCRINVITTFFDNIYAGRESAVYQSFIRNNFVHPLIGFSLVVVGILVLLIAIFQDFTQLQLWRKLFYLGGFCIVGGITYICDSAYEFIDLFLPFPIFNTLIDLLCMPFLLFFYLMFITTELQNKKTKHFMKWMVLIFAILESIPIFLQINGLVDLHVLQDMYVFMGIIIAFLGCGSILYEIIRCKNTQLKKILIASLPLIISLSLKLVNALYEEHVERTYLRLGILVCCVLLLNNTLHYVNRTLQLYEQEKTLKEELKSTQLTIMLSQIQPHFLYNALNTLQHICVKDGALAAEAIEHFSRYLRGNMDSLTDDKLIPFMREIEHVKHYVYIEQLRFGNRVQIEYDLNITDFYIPTLTLQPLVENAIRHGITKQEDGGIVKISTQKNADEILIIVSDNGVGFQLKDPNISDRRHIGIDNVKKRLQLQCNGTIDFISNQEVGTQVTIRLKGVEEQ